MAYQVAINGFGRIGRTTLRAALQLPEVEVVAVNDLCNNQTLAHLFLHDSAYGKYDGEVAADGDVLLVDGHEIVMLSERDPKKLPWKKLGIDVVIESTGIFTDAASASAHLAAGAKAVVISAPAKGGDIPTGVIGVNQLHPTPKRRIFSNASCTTNCITPVMAILEDEIGISKAMMTTVHAYTADQNLQDGPHADLRRARAAAVNIVPTTTGAAKVTGEVIPSLSGNFDGLAIRVPVPVGSLSDITAVTKRSTSVDEVNDLFISHSDKGRYKGIMRASNEPLVSTDIIGSTFSAIVDLSLTKVVDGNLLKVIAWYDNERGYSQRLIEQAVQIARQVS